MDKKDAVKNPDGSVSIVTVSSGGIDEAYFDDIGFRVNEHNRDIFDEYGELIDWRLRGKNLCVRIPADEKVIPPCAHDDDRDAGTVLIADGVEEIGEYTFRGCLNMYRIDIPDSVKKIGAYAFYDCWQLWEITVPRGLKKLENGVFSRCRCLESLILPDGLEEIGNCVFELCVSLQSIEIPSSVKKIGRDVFRECLDLKSVSYGGRVYDDPELAAYSINRHI